MKFKLLRLIIMGTKYLTYGILIQLLFISFLFAYDSNAQYRSVNDVYLQQDIQDKTVKEVLEIIENNSDFSFYYLNKDISKKLRISINAGETVAISDILLEVSRSAKLKFKQVNNNISVTPISSGEDAESIRRIEVEMADIVVTGTVTDGSTQDVLPGVNIILKGTSIGTITDVDGKYTISVPDDTEAILIFSSVGYISEEVLVSGKTSIDLTLMPDITALEEIVVIGYGTQQKKEITSSIVSVQEEDFNRGNINDPNQLLQGKVAGLQIARPGGNPNQPFTVRIRGLNTIGANQEPLVVIDGILGGTLDAVDPNDIKSIEVLKDASAAAIYGTRGSAGVLIVTTKSGKGISGAAQLDYNGYASFETISNTIDIASREEFLELGGQDFGSSTDWLDEVTRTGVSQVHNLSMANSSQGFAYRASLNYRDVKGVVRDANEFKQFNARLSISQKFLEDKLTLGATAAVTSRTSNIGYQQTLAYALTFNPTAPIFENRSASDLGGRDPDLYGGYFETTVQNRFNPVAINALNTHDVRRNTLVGSLNLDYEIIEGLSVDAIYTLQRESWVDGEYSARTALFGSGANGQGGTATRKAGDNTDHQFDATISYFGEKNGLNYNVVGGYSYNFFTFENFDARNTDFITDEFLYNNLGAGRGISTDGGIASMGSTKAESKLAAYFARATLNFQDQYFLAGSYRREGSSRFGSNNRWGDFWSLSGGFDLANILDISYFQGLKVRAGYGVNGNLPSQYYAYLNTLGTSSGGYVNGAFIPAVGPKTNPNPNLKWEEKAELNVGLDFAFMNSRFTGSFDYFTRDTKDLINWVGVPSPPNQVNSTLMNVGQIQTDGVELQLNFKAFDQNDFSWTIGANYATAKTKLVKWNANEEVVELFGGNLGAPGLNGINVIRLAEGEEIGQIMAQPFVRYEDGVAVMLNLDGSETTSINRDEFRVMGNALPDMTIGLNNTFVYKDFDLNFFFRGVFGHSLANVSRAYFEHTSVINRGNIVKTDGFSTEDTQSEAWHSGYVEDASFIRLDNASIGYNFNLGPNSSVRKLRLYVTGQNLLTFTSYLGSDPEVRYYDPGPMEGGNSGGNQSFSGNSLYPGVDRRVTYPPTRMVSVGVNIGL
ncbi:MAG: SusC/RagA family TonB-linked outer membrane protein [Cytophagales bacterium]|nr:SusC/RagA family TonB-linked outer membrane protein [Cytophagales bacterium]